MLSALFLSSALLIASPPVENSGGVGGHLIAGFNACIAACNDKLDKSEKTDNLVAQITLKHPFMAVISEMDAMGRPVIFLANDDPDLETKDASNYAISQIGKHYNIHDVDIYVIDTSQYEVCCEVLGLSNTPYKTSFVLYFNGNAFRFYFDRNADIDFLSEFRRMGWVPAQTRLTNFLEQNPHNQEAIGRLFSLAVEGLRKQVDYLKQQPFNSATKNDEALNDALSLFVKTLEFIAAANGFEWMSDRLSILYLFDLGSLGNAPIITENRKLQIVSTDLLASLERSIMQRPLSQPESGYHFWAGFATLIKNRPDPMIFLRNLSFPKNIDKADIVVPSLGLASAIALQYFSHPKTNKDGMPVAKELLTFFRDATEWMLEWDPNLDGVFRFEYNDFAKIQAVILIKLQMYSELEKHLDNTRRTVKSEWPKIVDALRNNDYGFLGGRLDDIPQIDRKRIDAILELPALAKNISLSRGIFISHNFDKESFDKLHDALLQRNVYFPLRQNRGLPENSWSLFSSNVHVASGSIKTLKDDSSGISELVELARNEEIKNLTALERQIRLKGTTDLIPQNPQSRMDTSKSMFL